MEKQEALKARPISFTNSALVIKELNETSIWLRIIERSEILRKALLIDIIRENKELCRILTASLRTARTRKKYQTTTNDKWKMTNGK
jgi:hypothetical protein